MRGSGRKVSQPRRSERFAPVDFISAGAEAALPDGVGHRKDGLIVKERGDLISATRVGLMTAPHAADGDYDPLAGAPAGGRVGSTR